MSISALTGRDDNPTMSNLENTLDAGGLPIQALEVYALRFLQHAVKSYHAKE